MTELHLLIVDMLKEAGFVVTSKPAWGYSSDQRPEYYVGIDLSDEIDAMTLEIDSHTLILWDRRVKCLPYAMNNKRTISRFDVREPECFEKLINIISQRLNHYP